MKEERVWSVATSRHSVRLFTSSKQYHGVDLIDWLITIVQLVFRFIQFPYSVMYCRWLCHHANSEVVIQRLITDWPHTLTESTMGLDLSHCHSVHHTLAQFWIYGIPRCDTLSNDTGYHVIPSSNHMTHDMSKNPTKCYHRPWRVHCSQSGYSDRHLSWAELMLMILYESHECTIRTYNEIWDFLTDCPYFHYTLSFWGINHIGPRPSGSARRSSQELAIPEHTSSEDTSVTWSQNQLTTLRSAAGITSAIRAAPNECGLQFSIVAAFDALFVRIHPLSSTLISLNTENISSVRNSSIVIFSSFCVDSGQNLWVVIFYVICTNTQTYERVDRDEATELRLSLQSLAIWLLVSIQWWLVVVR